ncbi:ethylene-responsive transcription factor ERF026-like [Dendrobium catenatum]|nr:ethylene-responsive transcription factor ERF026-like [Dendrobium catenatum]
MAAIAYDVAMLTIHGDNAIFNFPDIIRSHPMPKSNSTDDIRVAAKAAVEQFSARPEPMETSEMPPQETGEYVDEEKQFNMPQIIRSNPVPISNSISDIGVEAEVTSTQFSARPEPMDTSEVPPQEIVEYVDEEELFNMPQILIEMAQGLMMSPPRFGPA